MNTFESCQNFLRAFHRAAEAGSQIFRQNTPFPHVALDGLFDDHLLDKIREEFPQPTSEIWERTEENDVEIKLRSNWTNDEDISPTVREVVRTLNSGRFLRSLSLLTGIPHLISDPYYTGGGLNCILPGGKLDVHVDGNWHHTMAVHRRLNAIVYLNKNWNEDWNGSLELWDEELKGCVKQIYPVNNRLVIFETHDLTYHGHPKELSCPKGDSRKSLILYYYTSAPRPNEQIVTKDPHRALWKNRGELRR